MSTFEQDLLKILLDKILLGVVAAVFGFYLARLLENHKNKKAYELFVWQQRIDALRSASRIITEHYFSISSAFDGLKAAATKGAMSPDDENGRKLMAHAENHAKFRNELIALAPFLVPSAADAVTKFLNETGRVSDLMRGKLEGPVPTQDELSLAHSEFQSSCSAIIDAGPFYQPKFNP